MDERAARDVSRTLESTFADAGGAAGEAFSRELGRALSSIVDVNQGALDKIVRQADAAGAAIGAALIGGISGAALALEKDRRSVRANQPRVGRHHHRLRCRFRRIEFAGHRRIGQSGHVGRSAGWGCAVFMAFVRWCPDAASA
jgi:hypothetical protein